MASADEVDKELLRPTRSSDDKGSGSDESGDGVVEVVEDAEQEAPGEPGGHHRLLTGGPPKQSGKHPCRI